MKTDTFPCRFVVLCTQKPTLSSSDKLPQTYRRWSLSRGRRSRPLPFPTPACLIYHSNLERQEQYQSVVFRVKWSWAGVLPSWPQVLAPKPPRVRHWLRPRLASSFPNPGTVKASQLTSIAKFLSPSDCTKTRILKSVRTALVCMSCKWKFGLQNCRPAASRRHPCPVLSPQLRSKAIVPSISTYLMSQHKTGQATCIEEEGEKASLLCSPGCSEDKAAVGCVLWPWLRADQTPYPWFQMQYTSTAE